MRPSALLAFALLASVGFSQSGVEPLPGSQAYELKRRLDREENDRWIEKKRREEADNVDAQRRADQNARIAELEADRDSALYDYRNPTKSEVEEMQAAWKSAHPFTLSSEMPKFENRQIRVPRTNTELEQLHARLAAQERAVKNLQGGVRQSSQQPRKQQTNKATAPAVSPPAAPSAPNPNGVSMRTMSDGRVVAIIGGKTHKFANQADATAFIEKLRSSTGTSGASQN